MIKRFNGNSLTKNAFQCCEVQMHNLLLKCMDVDKHDKMYMGTKKSRLTRNVIKKFLWVVKDTFEAVKIELIPSK